VVHDACIRAYRDLPNFRGEAQFYTWLYRIAVNTAKNPLVARKRRPPASDVSAEDAEHLDLASRLHDHDTPERQLLRQEIEQAVAETAAQLRQEQRQAIILRHAYGPLYDEVAQ